MNLGERLKTARESLGYTQKEMAIAINTNPQTWQVYETGKSIPGGKVLEALALMGFNVNWLLTGKGKMKHEEGVTEGYSNKESFVDRLNKIHVLSNEKLSDDTGITVDKITELLSGDSNPTDEEIQLLAKALVVNPEWLKDGDSVFTLNKVGLDEDLISIILAAIEIVANDLGRDENILSVSDRIMITIKIYNMFSEIKVRPFVTLDNMIEQVMTNYFLRVSAEKLENLRSKIQQNPPNAVLNIIDYFVSMRKGIDEITGNEEKTSQKKNNRREENKEGAGDK